MTTVHLLQSHPHVAETYRRRFRHVLVDEYQDTNHAQYVLIKELVSGTEGLEPAELCVVGDADQSIYAFRGATIRNILEFERDFTDARTILLEQNYRSTQTILNAANAVIDRNTSRKPKRLWSDAGSGEQIVGYVADTEHAEADWVAREIDRLVDAGEARPGDVAVFYRTNAQSRVFEEVFIRVGLPYKVVGGVRFYERKEVRDALAYLRAVVNDDDTVSLRRILNTPRRGIGERAEACVEALASRDRISFGAALRQARNAPGISTRAANGIAEFVALLDSVRELAVDRHSRGGAGGGADPLGLPDRAGGEPRPAGRRPGRQPPGAGQRRPGVHRAGRGARAEEGQRATLAGFLEQVALVADADQIPSRRPRPPGRGHPDDAAHRQGPGVPGGLPDRPGGRRLPAPALAGRHPGAGGGAAAGVRRHHPGPAAALPLPGGDPLGLGAAGLQPAVPVRRGVAARAGSLGADRGVVHLMGWCRWRRGSVAPSGSSGGGFTGGTPRATQLARRLGVDGSRLATASELPQGPR